MEFLEELYEVKAPFKQKLTLLLIVANEYESTHLDKNSVSMLNRFANCRSFS